MVIVTWKIGTQAWQSYAYANLFIKSLGKAKT